MKKGISGVLIALSLAIPSVMGMTGSAHANPSRPTVRADTSGGCRYDYAYVALGYYLKPCVYDGAAYNEFYDYIHVKVAPNSTDVYVCGRMIPINTWGVPEGPEHCEYLGTSPNRWIYPTFSFNDDCNDFLKFANTDYVLMSYIKDNGKDYGDVESPPITCYY